MEIKPRKVMVFYIVPQVDGARYYGRAEVTMLLTSEGFTWFEEAVMETVPDEVRTASLAGRAMITGTQVLDA